MPTDSQPSAATPATVPAGLLAPWRVGDLPRPPAPGWRLWIGLLGPGVVLAGTSVGSGEWLFGPAVSAQYGGTILWLASISIILQVFCNLMMMRYTVYCGEPIIVGGLRTRPGPRYWIPVYLILDIASIWPYNASNAAIPLAATILGHLPGDNSLRIAGTLLTESQLVRGLGFAIFILCFVPLIFGGTVYRMLEKIMSVKLVLVLGYLAVLTWFMVSPRVGWEVATGFFRFGDYPQRADTILVDRHFALSVEEDGIELFDQGNERIPGHHDRRLSHQRRGEEEGTDRGRASHARPLAASGRVDVAAGRVLFSHPHGERRRVEQSRDGGRRLASGRIHHHRPGRKVEDLRDDRGRAS